MTAEIIAMPRRCAVQNCLRARMTDALVCREHMGDLYANRLERTPAGAFQPEWLRRMQSQGLPAKDMTGSAA